MADYADARTCATCGTLTAMAGDLGDPFLTGTCAACSTVNTLANVMYNPALAPAAEPEPEPSVLAPLVNRNASASAKGS